MLIMILGSVASSKKPNADGELGYDYLEDKKLKAIAESLNMKAVTLHKVYKSRWLHAACVLEAMIEEGDIPVVDVSGIDMAVHLVALYQERVKKKSKLHYMNWKDITYVQDAFGLDKAAMDTAELVWDKIYGKQN
jgi:hypothetical protein